jgi:hypothetical protein
MNINVSIDETDNDVLHLWYGTQRTSMMKNSQADSENHVKAQCNKMLDGQSGSIMLFNMDGESVIALDSEKDNFRVQSGNAHMPIFDNELNIPYGDNKKEIEKLLKFFATVGDD